MDDDTPAVDADGPACGSAGAATYFLAVFTDAAGVHFTERRCCCFRHVPRPADLLPPDAGIFEVVLEDARGRTVVTPEGAKVTVYGSAPVFIPAGILP